MMTVRLLGTDVDADGLRDATPTAAEPRVLSEVSALAERNYRPVRLMVVPAHDVFAAIVATILGFDRRMCMSANRRRSRPTSKRDCSATPGRRPLRPNRLTFDSSSTTAAAAPTPIISAPIRLLSLPAISTSFIVSGSRRPRPSARTCTTTMSSEQRSPKWNSN